MRNNKLNTSKQTFRRFSSTDLVITQQVFPLYSKHRYISQNPLIFSLQTKNHNKLQSFNSTSPTYYGVFSIQKPKYSKAVESREDFQKMKSKSFNIKRIIDKSIKQGHILQQQKRFRKTGSKQFASKFDNLESTIRNKNIQSQFKQSQLSKQLMNLNKNLGVIINRSVNSRSEAIERRKSRLLYKDDFFNEEITYKNLNKERNTYFVNNFIKTKIKRKFKIDQKNQTVDKNMKKNPELNIIGKKEFNFEGNWVVPWQKIQDTQEDTFMQS